MLTKFLLAATLTLAIFLRIWNLDNIPPSLNWDEISLGYNSYSILKTGHDEWGQFMPLSFRAFGDYKLPGYVYLDVPFIAIFGLNEWSVRLPSAILGVGFVLLIFLILKKLTNVETAIWGSCLAGIIPWTIITSRIALEAQLALFLTTLGFYLFLLGLKKSYLMLASIIFGLTIFSYNTSRVVTPLLVSILTIFYWKELKSCRMHTVVALLVFLAFFSVALPRALLQDSSARYRWTTILDEGAINRINESRNTSTLPPLLTQLSYNKLTYFSGEVVKNYISHFHPNFLFFNGGSNYQFSVPGSGLLYVVLLPFLLLGIFSSIKQKKKWQMFVLSWMFIAPIPAAITRDSPHALRSLMMIPPIIILSSLGIEFGLNILSRSSKKCRFLLNGIVVIVLFVSLYTFLQNYTGNYVKNYSWAWQYGYKQVAEYVREDDRYDTIFISKKYGEPHEFILFYTKYDPAQYQNSEGKIKYAQSDWFWVDKFDKYVFLNDWEIIDKTRDAKNGLLVTSPGNFPEGSKLVKSIDFLDGQKAFDIVLLPQVQ